MANGASWRGNLLSSVNSQLPTSNSQEVVILAFGSWVGFWELVLGTCLRQYCGYSRFFGVRRSL